MARNSWFEFKQFRVEQHKAAMKVGTDGVLLGSWTHLNSAKKILDVGTGTGLIALMLAQRSTAIIDAVEIDEMACEEAKYNFVQSPWSNRLRVFHEDFHLFAEKFSELYDLIVSNPPFFINSLKTRNSALAVARHNDKMPFNQFITDSKRLLTVTGRLCVIIPYMNSAEFMEYARVAGFYLKLKTTVIPKPGRIPKRVLLEFTLHPNYPVDNEIAILGEDGLYTENYKILTSPYYPAF
jgi:tRNA1Val (adenine37-N6)-methyltransferase